MEKEEEYSVLIEWLQEKGHSFEEIEKIMERVRKYENEMRMDSVMDSIGAGRLNLDTLIKEALED